MVLRIILIVLLCLLLFIFFYPWRVKGNFSYGKSGYLGKLILCPFFAVDRFGICLYDSEKPKKEKKEKEKKSEKKRKKSKGKELSQEEQNTEKPKREMKPISELILYILNLLHKAGRGIKRIRVKLILAYGFPDPALTGKITGAVYAALPWFFSGEKRCRWQVYLYPSWCPEKTEAAVDFDVVCTVCGALLGFGAMIPDLLKIIPKKSKNRRKKK